MPREPDATFFEIPVDFCYIDFIRFVFPRPVEDDSVRCAFLVIQLNFKRLPAVGDIDVWFFIFTKRQ